MNGYLFERCFVSIVSRLATEKHGSHSEFGRTVFLDAESPVNVWRNIRNGNRGKLRDVSLKDAFNMAEAMNMNFADLCWNVQRELAAGWTLEQDICHQEEPKRGRPKKIEKDSEIVPPVPVTTAHSEHEKNIAQ